MDEMEQDGLVEIKDSGVFLTEIGRDFTQNIMNVFDSYDPPGKSYKDRLATVKKAKESQKKQKKPETARKKPKQQKQKKHRRKKAKIK